MQFFYIVTCLGRIQNGRKKTVYGFCRFGKSVCLSPKKVIWWALKRKGVVMARKVFVITEMHKNIKTPVKIVGK